MWRWSRRRKADSALLREARAGARLAEEAEAFLNGLSGEWYESRGREVPAWAYVNRIVHTPPGRLHEVASRASAEPLGRLGWWDAIALLANEILCMGDGDLSSIHRIQLDRLSTLESQLMSRGSEDLAPAQLVVLGQACLRDHPSRGPSS